MFGVLCISAVYGGMYVYQHRWTELEQEIPMLHELTDAYKEGLSTLSALPGNAIAHFYARSESREIKPGIEFDNWEGISRSGEITVNSTWNRNQLLAKMKAAGFSTGKLRKAQEVLDYIDQHKKTAMWDMYQSKVPASIKLAQAILESNNGKSKLARASNNHFGIKALPGQSAREKIKAKRYQELRDDEFITRGAAKGVYNSWDDNPYDRFETYHSVADSYKRHTELLTRPCTAGKIGCYEWIWRAFPVGQDRDITTMASLYQPTSKIAPQDYFDGQTQLPYYAACAAGLKMAGYATSKTYHKKITYLIETYELWRFDTDLVRAVEARK